MENEVLEEETEFSPGAVRSAERAVEARYSVYLDEAQRLIQAGVEEIKERGNVDPRVADIVRRAGLSNKAFYRHFRSKEELLVAVLDDSLRKRMAEFETRLAEQSSHRDRVRVWLWCVLEQAIDPAHAALTRPLLVYQARLAEHLGQQVLAHRQRLQGLLRQLLEEARASGELPGVDPEADAEAVYFLAVGWMQGRIHSSPSDTPSREEAARIVEFAIRGLQRG
jgi:AcrR family transcriptional regulator